MPDSVGAEKGKELWLALFNAETKEALAKLEALEDPTMKQAIEAYWNITASSEFRESERLRSKAHHDEAQALRKARLEEREKWQSVISTKNAMISDKDAMIADKDAMIAELRAQLKELGK